MSHARAVTGNLKLTQNSARLEIKRNAQNISDHPYIVGDLIALTIGFAVAASRLVFVHLEQLGGVA